MHDAIGVKAFLEAPICTKPNFQCSIVENSFANVRHDREMITF